MQKKTKMYEAPQVLVETTLETATIFAQSGGTEDPISSSKINGWIEDEDSIGF